MSHAHSARPRPVAAARVPHALVCPTVMGVLLFEFHFILAIWMPFVKVSPPAHTDQYRPSCLTPRTLAALLLCGWARDGCVRRHPALACW